MSKIRIAVLASGGGSNLQAIIDATKESGFNAEIAVVVVNRKGAYAKERAEQAGIPTFYVGKGNCASTEEMSERMLSIFETHQIDLIVLAGYLSILSESLVKRYEKRIINIHPSLIPKYCGMHFHGEHVHQAVLDAGEAVSGATVHFVDAGVDTGAVISQMEVMVLKDDTVETLKNRVLQVEHHLLVAVIRGIAHGRIQIGVED